MKHIPKIADDCAFSGSEGDDVTIRVLVALDRRTQMILANMVPRKRLAHENVAKELEHDVEKLGYHEVLLRCGGEIALKSVHMEVKRLRRSRR